jgi:hypothetical protein
VSITVNDTKKSVYIINNNKITGDISSIVIPHDFAIGVDGLSKSLVVHGTARFDGDVQIIGTLYGGSPVKISGGINVVGGAEFDGVDVGTSIADVPDIKNRIGIVEIDYMQSKDLDSTVAALANNKTSSFGTKISSMQTKSSMSAYTKTSKLDTKISSLMSDTSTSSGSQIALLQTKADLTSDVESISSYTTLQSELATTKSDLTTLNSSLSTSSFSSGTKPSLVSDKRLKQKIENIEKPFKVINKLKPVTYYWNENASKLNCYDNDIHFGFIAQDIKEVLPTIVSIPDENGNLSININNLELISILVSAVKDNKKQIEELKSKVLELENSNI